MPGSKKKKEIGHLHQSYLFQILVVTRFSWKDPRLRAAISRPVAAECFLGGGELLLMQLQLLLEMLQVERQPSSLALYFQLLLHAGAQPGLELCSVPTLCGHVRPGTRGHWTKVQRSALVISRLQKRHNQHELEQPQGVVSRLQAAEFGGQPVPLLLQLLHLKSVLSETLLSLVGLFVVFQLALKAAVCSLQLGQLKDGNQGVKTFEFKFPSWHD